MITNFDGFVKAFRKKDIIYFFTSTADQISHNFSSENAAFAGLVEGRQTAFTPVCGKIIALYNRSAVLPFTITVSIGEAERI